MQTSDTKFNQNYKNYLKIMDVLGLAEDEDLTDEAVEHLSLYMEKSRNLPPPPEDRRMSCLS